uniref:Ionotropic glutamate receptor C-terminal domain-containing protein n=1 Tax=Corethron hystrix TaxID=216773 RepID=A0A7S1BJZ8_9STRA|mmetsp:Transcript_31225/g.71404  ORF Transcript_31225/g.71404 Transcript_31225/m.71404 type:complete len:516 (+) Transcript_31225:173-1720(+)
MAAQDMATMRRPYSSFSSSLFFQHLLLLTAFLLLPMSLLGQEAPYYTTPKFDRTTTHRTDLCGVHSLLFQNQTVDNIRNALRGFNISVGLVDYTGTNEDLLSKLTPDGKIPSAPDDYPGLFVVLMDELASRAGFSWRNTYGIIPPLSSETDGNRTWTDILDWSVDTYDISVDYWSKSTERINKGISFPHGWYDASIIMVEKIASSGSGRNGGRFSNMFSFLQPFDTSVWILIVVSIIFTGLLYQLLDNMDSFADDRSLGTKPLASIFFSAIVFTTHFEFRPNTAPSMLLSWSWAFWALIVSAAYTANLASFLIDIRKPHVFHTSFEEALSKNLRFCARKGTNHQVYIAQKYPDANILPFESENGIYLALNDGRCDVALTQISTFQMFERKAKINGDCSLDSTYRPIQTVNGGFATVVDSGPSETRSSWLCTGLVHYAIDIHLIEMEDFIVEAYNDYLDRGSAQMCHQTNQMKSETNGDGDMRLSLKSMGGIFYFHYILSAIALAMAGFTQYHKRR